MNDLTKRLPRLEAVEQQSAGRVRDATQKVQALRRQHDQLCTYRLEYRATNAVVPALIVDAQCFIERLDQTIAQVADKLEHQKRLLEAEQNRWRNDRARVKALELLCERRATRVRLESQNSERRVAESLLVYKQIKSKL